MYSLSTTWYGVITANAVGNQSLMSVENDAPQRDDDLEATLVRVDVSTHYRNWPKLETSASDMDSVEMAKKNNGNGNGGESQAPRGRRITANDLSKAAEAAREAAAAASTAAEAVVVALESGEVDETTMSTEEGISSSQEDTEEGVPGKVAFEEFMAQLAGVLKKAGDNVSVTEHARWVKIESKRNGHKIYVAKGKNQVNRIESTLSPDLVPGAQEPDRTNGRIASYIPADPRAVSIAIRQLVQSDEKLRAPQRGGGGGAAVEEKERSGPGGGGRRNRLPEFN